MAVDGLGSVRSMAVTFRPPAPPPGLQGGQDPVRGAAERLGLTHEELQARISSDRSPSRAASSVAQADLTSAVRAGLRPDELTGTRDVDPAERSERSTRAQLQDQPDRSANPVLTDQDRLGQLSDFAQIPAEELGGTRSATELVDLLRDRGVRLESLRSVLTSGELLDVFA